MTQDTKRIGNNTFYPWKNDTAIVYVSEKTQRNMCQISGTIIVIVITQVNFYC